MFSSRSEAVRAFSRDNRGAVLINFGLCTTVLFACSGAAIDYNRWLYAKRVASAALDAAVLAGARTL